MSLKTSIFYFWIFSPSQYKALHFNNDPLNNVFCKLICEETHNHQQPLMSSHFSQRAGKRQSEQPSSLFSFFLSFVCLLPLFFLLLQIIFLFTSPLSICPYLLPCSFLSPSPSLTPLPPLSLLKDTGDWTHDCPGVRGWYITAQLQMTNPADTGPRRDILIFQWLISGK